MQKSNRERFWGQVDKSGNCWLWVGSLDREGYGRFQNTYAHRYSFELTTPKPLSGKQIDHICHNKACVRPEHLRAVSNKQNQENRRGANSNSQSGVRGVNWMPRYGKWRAQFKHNGRSIYVGLFESIEAAEAAVIAKRRKVFSCSERDRHRAA